MSGAANNPYFETSREPSRDDLLRIMTAPNAGAHNTSSGVYEDGAANTTAGGYVGSDMYKTNFANAKTTIKSAFSGHVLNHRIWLTNAVANGRASSGASHKEVLYNMTNKRYFAGGHSKPRIVHIAERRCGA